FTSARLRPCNALASASSPTRLTTILPSSTLRLVRRGNSQLSLPLGPSTKTCCPLISTFTLGGMAIGCFPMRLIKIGVEELWSGGVVELLMLHTGCVMLDVGPGPEG